MPRANAFAYASTSPPPPVAPADPCARATNALVVAWKLVLALDHEWLSVTPARACEPEPLCASTKNGSAVRLALKNAYEPLCVSACAIALASARPYVETVPPACARGESQEQRALGEGMSY